MKYAIFSDDFLSYFRLDDNGSTLVLTDKQGYTRAVSLLPYDERPQVTVFTENADEKAIEDMKAELQNVLDNDRTQGEWGKWVISEIRCPECLEYFDTDCYSTEELKKCPSCGADMRKGGAE